MELCFNSRVETEAYIGLGSNQGDRELNLLRAVAEAGKLPDSRVTGLSPFYETSPVGVYDQPLFLNAVLKLSTRLEPHMLLRLLLEIEYATFRRDRAERWGPRSMDLDLLLFGNQIINDDDLIVPHPRMAERRFVLEPLCVLAPDLIHPVLKRSIRKILAALSSTEQVVRI